MQVRQKSLRFVFVLKSEHAVIGVSNENDITTGLMCAPVVRPGVKDVVQVDVGQQRGYDCPLRGAPFAGDPLAVFDDSGLEPLRDEPQ